MADRYFYLGPWQWVADDGEYAWQAPVGTQGAIDLRPLPAQGRAGGAPEGVGVFVTDRVLGSDYTLVGNALDDNLTSAQKSAWSKLAGVAALDASRLIDVLWETLTVKADPTGDTAAKPLIPTNRGQLEIYLPPHGRIAVKRFSTALVEWVNIRELLRQDYKLMRAECLSSASDHYRKALGWWVDKYRVPYREFQSADVPDEPPLPHAMTITDDFNRSDADPPSNSAEGWSWTEVSGNVWAIVSNQLTLSTISYTAHDLRAESDLSGTDHQTDADIQWTNSNTLRAGLAVRYASGANTCYFGNASAYAFQDRIAKKVTGANTWLLSNDSTKPSTGSFLACTMTVNGSTLDWDVAAEINLQTTDSSISAGTRTGMSCYQQNSPVILYDNFVAQDLGAAPTARNLLLLGVGT